MGDYKQTINGKMMEIAKAELKKKAEIFEGLFSCDDVHDVHCRKCGKKWIHAELGPGEFAFYDRNCNEAQEWMIEDEREYKAVHFHICTCNFPIMIDNHYEELWETYLPEQMFSDELYERWGCDKKIK